MGMEFDRQQGNTKTGNKAPGRTPDRGLDTNAPGNRLYDASHRLGNRGFGRFLQAKLRVSETTDPAEREADAFADTVLRMPDESVPQSRLSVNNSNAGTVARACSQCEEAKQTEISGGALDEAEREETQLMAKRSPDAAVGAGAGQGEHKAPDEKPSNRAGMVLDVVNSGAEGRGLGVRERQFFEPRMGHDLSAIRIHDGQQSASSAKSIGALAYTVGRDIVFGAGRFAPGTFDGQRLLAHELAHTVQQGSTTPFAGAGATRNAAAAPRVSRVADPVVQRLTALDDSEFGELGEPPPRRNRVPRVTTPNPTAPAPPAPLPQPAPASFAPLAGSALTDRRAHGMSTDSGTMIGEIESQLFPTGGANPPCTPLPANFEATVAPVLSTALRAEMPSLAPADAPDPMVIASQTANVAMPLITSHYSPHAPSRSAAAFMALVSRKATNFADPIRNNTADFAEFLEWFAGDEATLRALTGDKCGIDTAWWNGFVTWLAAAGSAFLAPPHSVRERSALIDTFDTSVTQGGHIQFGRGFEIFNIPHTVVHEAMHLFQHPDLSAQINMMPGIRSTTDIIIEGFAEYLARGVRDDVVTALQAGPPPKPLSAGDEAIARTMHAYDFYVGKAVNIRDILYQHGQDGEEAIRRAFFLGEGWRFGLLETATSGSPIETDRAIPGAVDVRFGTSGHTILNPAALDPIVAYLTTRSVATVAVVGRASPGGNPADNVTLGSDRADAVRTYLIGQGVDTARISVASRGDLDQIPGGASVNRRATVTILDTRNEAPAQAGIIRP